MDKEMIASQAEDLVRRVLTESFHQKVNPETLSAIAEKVSKSIPVSRQNQKATVSRLEVGRSGPTRRRGRAT